MSSSWCTECGEKIRWVRIPSGDFLALDFDINPSGNVMLQRSRDYSTGKERLVAVTLRGEVLKNRLEAGEKLFMPHRTSCTAKRVVGEIPPAIRARVQKYRDQIGA